MPKKRYNFYLDEDGVTKVRKLLKEHRYPQGMLSSYFDSKIDSLIVQLESGIQQEMEYLDILKK